MRGTEIATIEPSLGIVLRTAREAAGVSQRRLASQAGVNHSSLSYFEAGKRPVSESFYANVKAALAVLIEQQGGEQA